MVLEMSSPLDVIRQMQFYLVLHRLRFFHVSDLSRKSLDSFLLLHNHRLYLLGLKDQSARRSTKNLRIMPLQCSPVTWSISSSMNHTFLIWSQHQCIRQDRCYLIFHRCHPYHMVCPYQMDKICNCPLICRSLSRLRCPQL